MKNKLSANRAKANVSVALILMMISAVVLNVASAAGGQASSAGKAPGAPENALQYNRTDTTPICQMEQITSRETHVFSYRNLTLMLNCTRNCELNITADSTVKPKILSLSIEPNQTMSLTMNMTSAPPSGEMVMERSLNFYLGIEPNATLQLSAQIRLHINQTELSQELNRVVNASRLTWMYWNRTRAEWETVESHMDQNGYLICSTDHFSTWTVAEIDPFTEPAPEPTESGFPMECLYVAAAIAIIVVVVGIVAYKKCKQ